MRYGIPFLTGLLGIGVFLPGCITAQESSLRETFQKVSPTVVVVKTTQRELLSAPVSDSRNKFVNVRGLGSGVLVRTDEKPFVLTASHVVQAADDLYVEFVDGRKIPAQVKSSVPAADLALLELRTAPQDIQPAILGDSDKMSIGDRIFIVGAPYGLTSSLTSGYIGARRKSNQMLGGLAAMELFQTDAAINTGNSGGPMFNLDGEVVGIVSHILTRSGGFEGTGFAVTSNLARRLVLDEASFWSGLEAFLLSGELAKVFNVPQAAGILVQRVAKRSPAENLDLRAGELRAQINDQELIVGGDIVLSVAGIEVTDNAEDYYKVRKRVADMPEDEKLTVKVLRAGKVIELSRRRGDL